MMGLVSDKGSQLKLLKALVLLSVVAAFIWTIGSWMNNPTTLAIKQVRIEGDLKHLSEAELIASVGSMVSTGYFGINKEALIEKINGLPWVERSQVRSVWPDTLVLTISEHNSYAFWNDTSVISDKGIIFSPSFLPDLDLASLKGDKTRSDYILSQLKVVNKLLAVQKLALVDMSMAKHGSWEAKMSNGVALKIGHQKPSEIAVKGILTLTSIDEKILERVESIDLRYPNGMSVKWKKGQVPKLTAVQQMKPAKG